MAESPLDIQVGGNHYKQYAIQPIELYAMFKLGAFEANIIKYSWRKKNGVEDLNKAIHYTDLMIHFKSRVGEFIPMKYVDEITHKNKLAKHQSDVLSELSMYLYNGEMYHLYNIKMILTQYMRSTIY